jgi:cobaltochelatase CobN
MIESARKGFWKPSAEQLKELARLHAEITKESGAACTDFVCNNEKLQAFVSKQLDGKLRTDYQHSMDAVKMSASGQKDMVLKEQNQRQTMWKRPHVVNGIVVGMVVVLGLVVLVVWLRRKK